MVPFTRWAGAADNLFSQVTHAGERAGEGRHLPWVEARRAAVILSRLRALAALLVALTLSLVLIDFIVFAPKVAVQLVSSSFAGLDFFSLASHLSRAAFTVVLGIRLAPRTRQRKALRW